MGCGEGNKINFKSGSMVLKKRTGGGFLFLQKGGAGFGFRYWNVYDNFREFFLKREKILEEDVHFQR